MALVTGASRGIGAAVAKLFAAQGAHIVAWPAPSAGWRSWTTPSQGAGGSATLVPQDLADLDSIDRLGAALHERFGKLDILVANAGVLGVLSPVAHVDPKVWDETMLLNVTVNYRLIRSLDPLLRLSDAGRAIFVTSARPAPRAPTGAPTAPPRRRWTTWSAPGRRRWRRPNIRVNLINPGATRTGMRAAAMPGEDPMTFRAPEDIAPAFLDLASPACTRHGETVNAQ